MARGRHPAERLAIAAAKASAGLLLYRRGPNGLEVLLAHPGGPWWRARDEGAWGMPKGGIDPGEDPFAAARREFAEEMGSPPPEGPALALEPRRQPSGKVVSAWAIEGDFDVTRLASNGFPMEWPPRSGKMQEFPEIDRAEWFALPEARRRILRGQAGFLDELERLLGTAG